MKPKICKLNSICDSPKFKGHACNIDKQNNKKRTRDDCKYIKEKNYFNLWCYSLVGLDQIRQNWIFFIEDISCVYFILVCPDGAIGATPCLHKPLWP